VEQEFCVVVPKKCGVCVSSPGAGRGIMLKQVEHGKLCILYDRIKILKSIMEEFGERRMEWDWQD
jgi:hypothetical protein